MHVDLDVSEIGRNYPVDLGIVADARTFLRQGPRRLVVLLMLLAGLAGAGVGCTSTVTTITTMPIKANVLALANYRPC